MKSYKPRDLLYFEDVKDLVATTIGTVLATYQTPVALPVNNGNADEFSKNIKACDEANARIAVFNGGARGFADALLKAFDDMDESLQEAENDESEP